MADSKSLLKERRSYQLTRKASRFDSDLPHKKLKTMIETIEMKSPYRKDLEKKQMKVVEIYKRYEKSDITNMELYRQIIRGQKTYTTVQGVLRVLKANGIDVKKRLKKRKDKKKSDERRTIEKRAGFYRG